MSPPKNPYPKEQGQGQQQQPSIKKQDRGVTVKGVRLKRFEEALVKLLPHVQPRYFPLPALSMSNLSMPPSSYSSCSSNAATAESTTTSANSNAKKRPRNATSATTTTCSASDWDPYWNALPPAARVFGTLPGQLSQLDRAQRKEDQIKSMMQCILALLPTQTAIINTTTIVDFGGGSGHLSLPLALLLPHCRIVCVDLKAKSLEYLHVKAQQCVTANRTTTNAAEKEDTLNNPHQKRWKPSALPNLWTYYGDIDSFVTPPQNSQYDYSFQIGIALHVCGEATDVVLRACATQHAHLVVAPCCVGKLNRNRKDPYIYHATAQNGHTISYPQSKQYKQCFQVGTSSAVSTSKSKSTDNDKNQQVQQRQLDDMVADDWNALAKAADYNHDIPLDCSITSKDRRNAARRTAKCLLEFDRLLFLQENYGASYRCFLTRMQPLTATPKHDILVAYLYDQRAQEGHRMDDKNDSLPFCFGLSQEQASSALPSFSEKSPHLIGEEDPVVQWTREHLLVPATPNKKHLGQKSLAVDGPSTAQKPVDSNDWTWQEEEEIRQQILQRFPTDSNILVQNEEKTNLSDNTTDAPSQDTMLFPTGMGRRKRKLIHFVADQLGLAHRSVGKKWGDKTVAVQRKPNSQSIPAMN